MMYIASVKNKENGNIEIVSMEYNSKVALANDLRTNGYAVRFIATEETFDAECEKYNARLELNKNIYKAKKNSGCF